MVLPLYLSAAPLLARVLELAYWPTMQMILWGFHYQFMLSTSSWLAQASGVLLAGCCCGCMFRSQLGVSDRCSFDEMYSRNLGHLFGARVAPIRTGVRVAGHQR